MRYGVMFLTSTLLAAQDHVLDELASERALHKFQAFCEARGTALWGISLCGPIVIADTRSRRAIANQQDPEGQFTKRGNIFLGNLPERFDISNTAIDWGGGKWTLVAGPLPTEPYLSIALVTHEAFHRIQEANRLGASDQPNVHLATETGRMWLRMELRALAKGLRAEHTPDLRMAINDALLFRERRYALHEGSREHEATLERHEGLPEYTGVAIALRETGETLARVARSVESFEDSDSYSRSFAYNTGPALGLLLDKVAEDWRKEVKSGASMESLLMQAERFKIPPDLRAAAESRAAPYGYRAVAVAEHERATRLQAFLALLTKQFVDGPTLRFPQAGTLNRSFNPSELVPFGAQGTYYPTGTFRAAWGKLQVDSVGAVLGPDYMSLRVSAPADAGKLTGPGWTLQLASGWSIRPVAAGSFEVYPANAGSGARQ